VLADAFQAALVMMTMLILSKCAYDTSKDAFLAVLLLSSYITAELSERRCHPPSARVNRAAGNASASTPKLWGGARWLPC
jgi:hypothetical protein